MKATGFILLALHTMATSWCIAEAVFTPTVFKLAVAIFCGLSWLHIAVTGFIDRILEKF